MLVTSPNEATSASCERLTPNAPRVSKNEQKRESVRNIYIGDDELLSSCEIKSGTYDDYRAECVQKFQALYPDNAKAEPLAEADRYPIIRDRIVIEKNTKAIDDTPISEGDKSKDKRCVPKLGGLYHQLGLSWEDAKRVSRFEDNLDKQWYVFRILYDAGTKQIEKLDIPDCDFFIPSVKRRLKRKGQNIIVEDRYLSHFFFAFTTRLIAEIIHCSPLLPHARIYYDHFSTDRITGNNLPLTIPNSQMLDFKLIAEAKSFDIKIIDPEKLKIPLNTKVEVIDGPFKGVRGYLAHVAGKQRVVSKNGFCFIATSYISSYGYKVVETVKNKSK